LGAGSLKLGARRMEEQIPKKANSKFQKTNSKNRKFQKINSKFQISKCALGFGIFL
jgi:hypothetical protein